MMYWKLRDLGINGRDLGLPWAERRFLPSVKTISFYDKIAYDKMFYDKKYSLMDVELEEGSSEVDFVFGSVEIGGLGFIINERLIKVFRNYNIPPNEVLPINVFHYDGTKTKTTYKWLHILKEDITHKVDFLQSEIIDAKTGQRITSHEAYRKLDFSDKRIFNKVIFEQDFDTDFFFFPKLSSVYYLISDRFKKELERQNVSGFIFEKIKALS